MSLEYGRPEPTQGQYGPDDLSGSVLGAIDVSESVAAREIQKVPDKSAGSSPERGRFLRCVVVVEGRYFEHLTLAVPDPHRLHASRNRPAGSDDRKFVG